MAFVLLFLLALGIGAVVLQRGSPTAPSASTTSEETEEGQVTRLLKEDDGEHDSLTYPMHRMVAPEPTRPVASGAPESLAALEASIDRLGRAGDERKLAARLRGTETLLKVQRLLIGSHHADELVGIDQLQLQYFADFRANASSVGPELARAYEMLHDQPTLGPDRAILVGMLGLLPGQKKELAAIAAQDPKAFDAIATEAVARIHVAWIQKASDPFDALSSTLDAMENLPDPALHQRLERQLLEAHPSLREELLAELDRRGIRIERGE